MYTAVFAPLVFILVMVLLHMVLSEKKVYHKAYRLFKKPAGRHRALPLPVRHRAQPERRPVRRSSYIYV